MKLLPILFVFILSFQIVSAGLTTYSDYLAEDTAQLESINACIHSCYGDSIITDNLVNACGMDCSTDPCTKPCRSECFGKGDYSMDCIINCRNECEDPTFRACQAECSAYSGAGIFMMRSYECRCVCSEGNVIKDNGCATPGADDTENKENEEITEDNVDQKTKTLGIISRIFEAFRTWLEKNHQQNIENKEIENKITNEETTKEIGKEIIENVEVKDATEAYNRYVEAYNKLAALMSEGKGDTPESQQAYNDYKTTKEEYELIAQQLKDSGKLEEEQQEITEEDDGKTTLDDLEKEPYVDKSNIEGAKEFFDDIQTYTDNINDALETVGKTEEELEALKDLSENFEGLKDSFEDIERGSDLWNIIMTDGPTQDWKDITLEEVEPGLWTSIKRGAIGFFTFDSRTRTEAGKVEDLYSAMVERKQEQEFYKQDVQDRLLRYVYEKTSEDLSDEAKEKVEDAITEIIGTGSMLSTKITVGSLEVLAEEGKKPLLGKYYLAYEQYRDAAAGSHENALVNMKVDIDSDAGIISGTTWGIEDLVKRPYWGINDNEVLMEVFKKIYDSEHPKEK
jgi:hypothetical protein